jgi:hypothetical protein
MLAYGSVNLGLSNIIRKSDLEERIKEDLKKVSSESSAI